ncbi:hypothetical protein, partial [Bosea sp. LjRoot90]|uniref:hypothetical protein n=1 Tax=Bosea sp. LjRoot90 TaxID=3342342 RepID=UPI003F504906
GDDVFSTGARFFIRLAISAGFSPFGRLGAAPVSPSQRSRPQTAAILSHSGRVCVLAPVGIDPEIDSSA